MGVGGVGAVAVAGGEAAENRCGEDELHGGRCVAEVWSIGGGVRAPYCCGLGDLFFAYYDSGGGWKSQRKRDWGVVGRSDFRVGEMLLPAEAGNCLPTCCVAIYQRRRKELLLGAGLFLVAW